MLEPAGDAHFVFSMEKLHVFDKVTGERMREA
jgi:hypothetical protein